MEKDRDQLTPDEPEDWAKLQSARGQGTGGTGYDRLPGEEAPAEFAGGDAREDGKTQEWAEQTQTGGDAA